MNSTLLNKIRRSFCYGFILYILFWKLITGIYFHTFIHSSTGVEKSSDLQETFLTQMLEVTQNVKFILPINSTKAINTFEHNYIEFYKKIKSLNSEITFNKLELIDKSDFKLPELINFSSAKLFRTPPISHFQIFFS